MKQKFEIGDRVKTHTVAVYQETQESLSNKTGTIINCNNNTFSVKLDTINEILEFDHSELSIFSDLVFNKIMSLIEDSIDSANPSTEVWVIKFKGKMILPSGKSFWRRQNHASSAFTNFIVDTIGYEKRRELGFRDAGEITKYLIEKGIITIEKL